MVYIPANAMLLACPFTSDNIAKVWQADLTTSMANLCSPMDTITRGMNPKEETYNKRSNDIEK